MQIGYFAVGIAATSDPEMIATAAGTAEECGFHSVWAPEHVVLFDQYASKYPYARDGRIPVSSKTPFLDPFLALAYAAAATRRVRLATGICLLPERNPVVTAKEVATLDVLSRGRFELGVGIGWLAEEFAAVGVPWERRAARTREYLRAMQVLWSDDETEFRGEFVSFPQARSYPKPVQKPHPPILFGGESEPALRRAGEVGDGWFGVNVTVEDARRNVERIRAHARAAGRGKARLHFSVSPGLGLAIGRDDLARYRDAGVDQVVLSVVARTGQSVEDGIRRLADEAVVPASKL
jgi:probable F420-dependent oxidoreductase